MYGLYRIGHLSGVIVNEEGTKVCDLYAMWGS